jgi:hypothetical protein
MPFNKSARIELVNEHESKSHGQYFYIDYELYDQPHADDVAYFHAQWHRENPFGSWGPEIKVTIEHGHGNHLRNEMASTAYWYQLEPHVPFGILNRQQRKPIPRRNDGTWVTWPEMIHTSREVKPNAEMKSMKAAWKNKTAAGEKAKAEYERKHREETALRKNWQKRMNRKASTNRKGAKR